ncbi:MAG TPA: hypothetical protein VKX17_07160 [Planctomycetota bacterium]|nr:hypothetical protein [Planctomycetota bacterium]
MHFEFCISIFAFCISVFAEERLIILDDAPPTTHRFTIAPDGSRIYIAGHGAFLVFDAAGKLIDQFQVKQGASAKALAPLPGGWFIGCFGYAGAHIGLLRPDGTEAKSLISMGSDEKHLRADPDWNNPHGIAIDALRKLIFVLDTAHTPESRTDPAWSRIAVFDLDGNYLRDICRFDLKNPDGNPEDRTYYTDIKLDTQRQRIYVVAHKTNKVLSFSYDGKLLNSIHVPNSGAVAVFPDGRIATSSSQDILIFDSEFKPLKTLKKAAPAHITDLAVDASSRLYAACEDNSVKFIRWPPVGGAAFQPPSIDAAIAETFGPPFIRLSVDFGNTAVAAGKPFEIKTQLERRLPAGPQQGEADNWHAFARPSDGSDLKWRPLPATINKGALSVTAPESFSGMMDIAVRFGDGPPDRALENADPTLQKTFVFIPPNATKSLSVITADGRRVYEQYRDNIPIQIVRREGPPASSRQGNAVLPHIDVAVTVEQENRVISTFDLKENYAPVVALNLEKSGLNPGHYTIKATAKDFASYPLAIDIVPFGGINTSPMQRILYHEFDQNAITMQQPGLDTAEKLAFIRAYVDAVADAGFTRETDRLVNHIDANGPRAWLRNRAPVSLDNPALPPAEWFAIPPPGAMWEAEYYLDCALAHGIRYDTQIFAHCAGLALRPSRVEEFTTNLQRTAQWLGKYPAFYGFNYNDEMFFGGYDNTWRDEDREILKKTIDEFKARVDPNLPKDAKAIEEKKARMEALFSIMEKMYDTFNHAIAQVGSFHTTAAPMWQYPAVEGTYPPSTFKNLSESYTHFLGEGYQLPWMHAHSVDMLKRPGKPIMGVFDNRYEGAGGDIYLKNMMQVLGRGVQGIGVEHTSLLGTEGGGAKIDAEGASAYKLGNLIAKMYGPIFAEVPPANEGAILYSKSQDATEGRKTFGTPHWERTYALYSAGLMASVPMSITFEEDVESGWLLDNNKPRVPMLFLTGQTIPLPEKTREALKKFMDAGGKIFTDADSAEIPGATKLEIKPADIIDPIAKSYAGDTGYPLLAPVLEKLAAQLKAAVGKFRRYPIDVSDPWVAAHHFDGGAVQYVLLSSETSPYPWPAGIVWELGSMYNKGKNVYLPKTVTLTLPATDGVVYDVFERKIVSGKGPIQVDLRTFPGRLYAISPKALGAPKITAHIDPAGHPYFWVETLDEHGEPVSASVPVRVRLSRDGHLEGEHWGCTKSGIFDAGFYARQISGTIRFEATSLLGGYASAFETNVPRRESTLETGEVVDHEIMWQLERKILENKKVVILNDNKLDDGILKELVSNLGTAVEFGPDTNKFHDIKVEIINEMPKSITSDVYVAAGIMSEKGTGNSLIESGRARGLFRFSFSRYIPGPGRGMLLPLFSPRGSGEHAVAFVGGDLNGLKAAIKEYGLLSGGRRLFIKRHPSPDDPTGKPIEAQSIDALRNLCGVKLSQVITARNSNRLLVTADGYAKNLALIEDQGDHATIVRTERAGQAHVIHVPFISADGLRFGAAAREVAAFGQGFHLFSDANARGNAGRLEAGAPEIFAAFGDMGRTHFDFAVSGDGLIAIAPGTFGAVCWKKANAGDEWKETWAIDYWKKYAELDWPISSDAERIPSFDAFIPPGADYALITFNEFAKGHGWITPENHCSGYLAAVALSDGKERWRFDVPVLKTLMYPALLTSPDGKTIVLQVQLGGWGKETYRYYRIEEGKAIGQWNAKHLPSAVAVGNQSLVVPPLGGTGDGARAVPPKGGTTNDGWTALAFKEQLPRIDVRRSDGSLVWSSAWMRSVISMAFSEDGKALYVADDSGKITRVNEAGDAEWSLTLESLAHIAVKGRRIYAAGWDGRVRCIEDLLVVPPLGGPGDGLRAVPPKGGTTNKIAWTLDCTPAMNDSADPMKALAENARNPGATIIQASRAPTTSRKVPAGENLFRNGKARLTLCGTKGWMSQGELELKAEALTNGKFDDVETPWLRLNELFWDAQAGRQVFAEIEFKEPTDVHSLTVYENANHPEAWPTEGLVQVWDESAKKWNTAARGIFMVGPVNTYRLDLKSAKKIRYAPWNSYYRNFYTSEIEVR